MSLMVYLQSPTLNEQEGGIPKPFSADESSNLSCLLPLTPGLELELEPELELESELEL